MAKDYSKSAVTAATRLTLQSMTADSERLSKALVIVESHGVTPLPNGNLQVSASEPNHFYQVNLQDPRCNCMDWTRRKHNSVYAKDQQVDLTPCKHMLAAAIYQNLAERSKLSELEQSIIDDLFAPTKKAAQ